MSTRRFVDTNILLYAKDASEREKQPIAEALMRELWRNRSGRLSVQVLNEYFVNVTQKLHPGLTREEAWGDLEALGVWEPQSIDFDILISAFRIQTRYQLSWWDSLIVAAAVSQDCEEILSEDLAEGETYEGVTVVNPFNGSWNPSE
jgi:predicted nucleic acid-binding protein